MTDQSFFLKQVPQSEYRRTTQRNDSERTYLTTEINPIGVTDPSIIVGLMVHIEAQADLVFSTLLPNKDWPSAQKSALLERVYKSLGISS